MATEVRNNAERSRYELVLDGELIGIADYRHLDGRTVFPHTEIRPAQRGRGWGAELVRGALDDVRTSGRQVVAQCWYVAEFIDDHPQYADLLAS
jgi:predicted GNAT family acetyltransferase